MIDDPSRSPLMRELEKAKKAELKKLGNVPGPGSPLLAELDRVRKEELKAKKPKKKRRRHSLKMIPGGKKELK